MKSVEVGGGRRAAKDASTFAVDVEKQEQSPMKASKYWATIDPGISGSGISLMKGIKLLDYGNIYPGKEWSTWEQRASSILIGIIQFLPMKLSHVYIEFPSQFSGAKGLAASNSNDILKLSCLIGRISELFVERGTKVILVPVQTWKGSLPKEIVAKRAMKYFGLDKLVSHSADAVGLAMFVLKEKSHGR